MLFKVTYPNGEVEHEHVEETGVTTIEAYMNRKFGVQVSGAGFSVEIVNPEPSEDAGDETITEPVTEGTGNELGE